MIDIQISSGATIGIPHAVDLIYDTKLRDFPACTQSLFMDGFSATGIEMDMPLWAYLNTLDTVDQGILLVYLLDAIRTN